MRCVGSMLVFIIELLLTAPLLTAVTPLPSFNHSTFTFMHGWIGVDPELQMAVN